MRPPARSTSLQLEAAVSHLRAGRPADARRQLEVALRADPSSPDAHHLLGLALIDVRKTEKGLQHLRRAVELRPNYTEAVNNLAIELSRLGRHAEAETYFVRALSLTPDIPDLRHNRALCLVHLDRGEEALRELDSALKLAPDNARFLRDRANVLLGLGRAEDALSNADDALRLRPGEPQALRTRASALLLLRRPEEARDDLEKSIRAAPDDPDTLAILAETHNRLREFDRALEIAGRALVLRPHHTKAMLQTAEALNALMRNEEALTCLDRLQQLCPGDIDLLMFRASVLLELDRHLEEIATLERVLRLAPARYEALGQRLTAKLMICDWSDYAASVARIMAEIEAGNQSDQPFGTLNYATSPAEGLAAGRLAAARLASVPALPLRRRMQGERIRLAYVSADFGMHVMGRLLAPLLAAHDRSRFEVIGVSLRPAEKSEMGQRARAACDRLVDVSQMNNAAVAALLRRMDVDIAIDVGGYTRHCRPGIFARRAAPVQVSYLGFPGTMGTGFMDVIIADGHIIPPEMETFYTERVVRLPDTLFPTEPNPDVAAPLPSRSNLGLPEAGFVFCCLNNSAKFTPLMFDSWARILRRVPDSVLWLNARSPIAAQNLQREAELRGLMSEQLVLATPVPMPDYLARLAVADLFLDTLPYNAGATAGHALWMGLPVLTCTGQTFVGRMAGSQIQAIGLPELIASTLAEYEEIAVNLATDAARLQDIRTRLAANRASAPLFDHALYVRNLEAAYSAILEDAAGRN